LTLNPLKHLDLLGTLAFFVARIGWAKPVPVDPRYYRDPRRGLTLVGIAGPLANFTLALVLAIPYRLGLNSPTTTGGVLLATFLYINVVVNISLGVFNLIPIPPLDGSKVLAGLLPPRYGYRIYQLESFGPILLLLVIMTGAVDVILQPLFRFFTWFILGPSA
jgi:Zn-dependent protease